MSVHQSREFIEARIVHDLNGGCWLWGGYISDSGYGAVSIGTARNHTHHLAHRLSYTAWNGPIPIGMVIDHKCRVRACVNPQHLRAVTLTQNTMENSFSVGALNSAKTHCDNGHPLTGNNLTKMTRYRECRICKNAAMRKWRRGKGVTR